MKFPSGCLVLDETAWADPNEFKPERFLGSSGGERVSLLAAAGSAGEIKMMPFGAGRRMCPGMGVAMLHLTYITANLVREFEWREMGGELAVDLEPSIAFFTLMKRQLRAHLVPRRKGKDVQVTLSKRSATIDFFIMEPDKGNIVLGRNFLRAMRGFIDLGKGHIRLRGKAKGTYPVPRKNEDELVEDPFDGLYNSDNFEEL
ncbi:Cytochrome P450 89A2 [Hordeum vulgare]|nr:Cytochrome P450 89A2 [Hordeum vulgare]